MEHTNFSSGIKYWEYYFPVRHHMIHKLYVDSGYSGGAISPDTTIREIFRYITDIIKHEAKANKATLLVMDDISFLKTIYASMFGISYSVIGPGSMEHIRSEFRMLERMGFVRHQHGDFPPTLVKSESPTIPNIIQSFTMVMENDEYLVGIQPMIGPTGKIFALRAP